jgi:hypothetical protein
MGVIGNIYCIPETPGSVAWSTVLTSLVQRALVRPPYRTGSPFEVDSDRTAILWPENWIVPETLRATSSNLPLRDYQSLEDALLYERRYVSQTCHGLSNGAPYRCVLMVFSVPGPNQLPGSLSRATRPLAGLPASLLKERRRDRALPARAPGRKHRRPGLRASSRKFFVTARGLPGSSRSHGVLGGC